MSNPAIALKGLLERSHKDSTFLIDITPHLGPEEQKLRLSYLNIAHEAKLIRKEPASVDDIVSWILTSKGLQFEGRLRG